MRELKVLIVDDEIISRQTLKKYIDWKSLGISEVLEAQDGQEALEIALHNKPELIISDIKMPHMDGLTLAQEVLKKYPSCLFIFLSGYANKENLKEAIKLDAVCTTFFIGNPQVFHVDAAIIGTKRVSDFIETNNADKK